MRTPTTWPRWARMALLGVGGLLVPSGAIGQEEGVPPPNQPLPRPPGFAKAPETPEEVWGVVDFFTKVGQPDQALPYLKAFLARESPDSLLLELRDRYGVGTFLRLQDDPKTAALARPLIRRLVAAQKRQATDIERLKPSVALLGKSPEERRLALNELRRAGSWAVPAIASGVPEVGEPATRALSELEQNAVPGLVGALEAPDPEVAAAAARALGQIGDREALPFLIAPAHDASKPALASAAQEAWRKLSGAEMPADPAKQLAAEAGRYLAHKVRMPGGETVTIWTWPEGQKDGPVPQEVSPSKAEEILGLRLADRALKINPDSPDAKLIRLAIQLDKAVERAGAAAFSGAPTPELQKALDDAKAAGPGTARSLLDVALHDRLPNLGAAAIGILGPDLPALARASTFPDRRVQYAAARAMIGAKPERTFPGASHAVPTLARFLDPVPLAQAAVITVDTTRGNQIVQDLKALGYEGKLYTTGVAGVQEAFDSAYVELIVVGPGDTGGHYDRLETLKNLRADARSAGIPIFLAGTDGDEIRLERVARQYPRMGFIVAPGSPQTLQNQIIPQLEAMGHSPLADSERSAFAKGAAEAIAAVAADPKSPFAPDLPAATPALLRASRGAEVGGPATTALSGIPDPDAQRRLAEIALDVTNEGPARLEAARWFIASEKRFGPLLTSAQILRLADAAKAATDPELRKALADAHEAAKGSPGAGVDIP